MHEQTKKQSVDSLNHRMSRSALLSIWCDIISIKYLESGWLNSLDRSVAVNDLVTDPMLNTVLAVTGSCASMLAKP